MTFFRSSTSQFSRSIFSSIWGDIKRPIKLPFTLIIFYKVVSTLQILGLMLEIPVKYFHHTKEKPEFMKYTGIFTFYDVFEFTSDSSMVNFTFIVCWMLLLLNYLLLMLVSIQKKFKIRRLSKLSPCMQHVMLLHQFILFLPTQTFMLQVIHNSMLGKIILFSSSNNALFSSFGIMALCLNFFITILNLHCYSPLYAQKTFTKRNAYLASLDFIFKAFLSIYIVFISSSTQSKWIVVSITTICILLNYNIFHTQLPFFQVKALEAYCWLLGSKISMALSVLIVAVFDEFRSVSVPDLPIAAFLLIVPLCIKGQRFRMIQTIAGAVALEYRNYNTENVVFIHLVSIRYLFKKGAQVSWKQSKEESTDWNMLLNGVVTRHNVHCNNTKCGCITFLDLEDAVKGAGMKKEKYKELEMVMMRELYEKGSERLSGSDLIHLNLAQFYLIYLENYLRTYLVLQTFETNVEKSFESGVLVEYLKIKVQERMERKLSGGGQQELIENYNSSHLNVTSLVQNDLLFIRLKKLIHEQINKQLRFWELMDNLELNTRAIEACCKEIDIVRKKVEKLWEELSRVNQKYRSHYLLYGLYLMFVNNMTTRGERSLSEYSKLFGVGKKNDEGITNDNMSDPETVVIKISMRRDKIGIIEECSGDIESMFGYQGSHLINSNVATIMSPFFKERHHTFVMNHFEKGTENVLNRMKRLFGYHKEGHIFPIFLYVSIYPNIETGLSYMGILRHRKVHNNHILIKTDGTIDSYSPEVAEHLGLDNRRKYNIMDICPDFEMINKAFNYLTRIKHDLKEEYVEIDSKREYLSRISQTEPRVTITESVPYKSGFKSLTSDRDGGKKDDSILVKEITDSNTEKGKDKNKGIKMMGRVKSSQKRLRRVNTEEAEEYKKIYDQLMINGSVLGFLSQQNKMEASLKSFLCTVNDEVFDYSILRVVTMGVNHEKTQAKRERDLNKCATLRAQEPVENSDKGFKNILSVIEQEEVGISNLPNFHEQQLFRNPFVTLESEGDQKEWSSGIIKEDTYKIVKTQQDGMFTQVQFSISRNDTGNNKERKQTLDNNNSTANNNIRLSVRDDKEESEQNNKAIDSINFIQEMLHGVTFNERSGVSSTSSTSRIGGVVSKLETLVYKKEEDTISKKRKAYVVIILTSVLISILNTSLTNTSLEKGSNTIQSSLLVGQRIKVLLELSFNCRMLLLYLNDFILVTRHQEDKQISNYPQFALDNVKTGAEDLVQLNTAIINDIKNLKEDSHLKFFGNMVELAYPVQSKSDYNVKELNSFEAINTLSLSAVAISSTPLAAMGTKQADIKYILLNSMNNLYMELKNEYKIYEDDLESKLSEDLLISLGFAIVLIIAYLIFLVFLILDLIKVHQDKVRFWGCLVKLDTVKSTNHKKILQIMKENFETSSYLNSLKKGLIQAKKQELREAQGTKAKESQASGFKKLKSYKLKNRNYFVIFPFFVVLSVILGFFITSEVLMINEMDYKRVYMQEINQAENYYQLNLLTLNGIYELISEGEDSQLEGNAITQTLQVNIMRLSNFAGFLLQFQAHSDFDPRAFMQMDICEIYSSSKEKAECSRDDQGVNSQGLVGALAFAKQVMENLLDIAMNSDTDPSTIRQTLRKSDLLKLENQFQYISDVFTIMVQKLAANEREDQNNLGTTLIIMIVVFVIALFLLNYLMVWRYFKRLEGQKFDNLKVLRAMPVNLILESKLLKAYLLKSFKNDLGSVSNKLL